MSLPPIYFLFWAPVSSSSVTEEASAQNWQPGHEPQLKDKVQPRGDSKTLLLQPSSSPMSCRAKGWRRRNAAHRAPRCNAHSLFYPIKEAKLESKGQRHTVVLALYNWQGWGQQQLVHMERAEQSEMCSTRQFQGQRGCLAITAMNRQWVCSP